MSSDFPTVSVVLPTYNGARHVAAAIDSILSQTYNDFELVIVDDGSTDETWSIVTSYNDRRIVAVRHEANTGLVAALTTGLSASKGRLIARHDQDDVSAPMRLQHQVDYLKNHPEVALLGTWARVVAADPGATFKHVPNLHHPVDDLDIRWWLLWNNPFVHGSVIFRRVVVEVVGGYLDDEALTPPEDYELWSRIAKKFSVANLPIELLLYRQSPCGMSATYAEEMGLKSAAIALGNIHSLLPSVGPTESAMAISVMNGELLTSGGVLAHLRIDLTLWRLACALRRSQGHLPLNGLWSGILRNHKTHIREVVATWRGHFDHEPAATQR